MHANNEGVGMNAAQLVAAVQNLQQMVAEGQQREAQLRSQVEALANQAQQTAAVGGALPHGVATAFEALASSQKELVESLKGKEKPKLSLVDTRGLAKPEKFTGKEEVFLYWRTRLEAFITATYPQLEAVLSWAEESDVAITDSLVDDNYGATAPEDDVIEGIDQMNSQVYAVLQTLCEAEAFTIVRSAGWV